ncbi:MAG: hypothetical protein P1U86_19430 [Verrucomicrobiales bacterium]|nr:hypothetical protein [Verrucomicrobiales bacterium]
MMRKFTKHLPLAIILAALLSGNAFGAEAYPKGAGALEVFDGEAMSALPLPAKLWLKFMMLTFAAGLIFFAWKKPIARWAAGGMIVSMATCAPVFTALGLPVLSGSIAIWHIVCWSPALVLLLTKRPFLKSNEGLPYRTWSVIMTGVILISFIFDFRDAAIYIHHFTG